MAPDDRPFNSNNFCSEMPAFVATRYTPCPAWTVVYFLPAVLVVELLLVLLADVALVAVVAEVAEELLVAVSVELAVVDSVLARCLDAVAAFL